LALDPGLFAGTEEYMKRSRELVESIKSAKPITGQRVSLPGERGDELAKQAMESGEVEIADAIWNELVKFVG
jgi:LDH2 family malate/lactate/ureidoglycolate dehydrogenase